MSKRIDERHSRILASLLKLSENKKCFDCSSKVNVYANLFNSTFICERCSGLHREFNHRVKSISASTFSPDEIAALQRGGNGVAKTTWLATWSWQEYPEPDSNNNDEVRRFMRAKYVKRLWHVDGNATSATSGTSKDSTPRPSTASSAPRPSNASTSSAQASPSRTPVPSSTSPNIALAKAAVGGTGASISERTLSRKSSTLSTDSGSTNLSRSTDPSSAGSSPFHPTTSVTSGSKPLSTTSHQQLPSSNLGQYSFSHFQQTLATTPTGHADSDADPFSLMQSSFANMQMSRDNIQQQRQQQQQQQQQQAPLPSRSFTAPTPSSNQYGSFADFESAFSSAATPSHPPPMPSVLPGASSSANDFFAAFHSSPSSSSSAPVTSTGTTTTTTTNAAMMTSIPRGMTSPSFATTSSSVNGMVASPSMLSPMPMHSANDYFGAGAGAGAGTGAGAGAGAGMHSLSVGAASGARSFDDFLSSMGGGPSLSSSAHTNAKATISDIGNPFGLGGNNSAAALTTQLPAALQRAHTSAYPSVGGGGGVGGSGGGSTNPFAAFAKSSSSSSTLGSSNLDPLHDVFGHSSRGTNMTMSSSNGVSAANPFSAPTTGIAQHSSSLSSSSSNTLFQSQHGHGLLQQAPYHTNGLSTTTMTATTSAGSDWASSAFASSTTTTLTGNSAMPAMLTRATTEPTVSHFATGYGGGGGAPVEDMFGSWASKTPSMPNNSQQQQRHNTNSNSGTANAFGVNDFDPFGFHPHNHHHHHQHHQHAASASTNPFGL